MIKKWHQLTRWEQLNVNADSAAKAYWNVTDALNTPSFDLPAEGVWSLWHKDRRLTSWSLKIASHIAFEQHTLKYWHKRHHQTHYAPHAMIDWKTIGISLRSLPFHRRLWQSKWCSSYLPIGKNLKRWKICPTDACPRCGEPEDHRFHVIRCPEAKQVWDNAIDKLSVWLTTSSTAPDLKTLLISALQQWYRQELFHPPMLSWHPCQEVIRTQTPIGWQYMIDGFLSSHWASTQQKYFEWLGRRQTGRRWVSKLLKQLWNLSWVMWRHRQDINSTPESKTLVAIHDHLDSQIIDEFDKYATHPSNRLHRWFSQPLTALRLEDADFKHQWLEAVHSARHAQD